MKIIRKDKITGLLGFLAEKYELFAPTQTDSLVVSFERIRKGKQARLGFSNSNDAPKKLFFPQAETLFSYSEGGCETPPELEAERQRVIFGLRPCDTKSLSLMDKVFDTPDFKDPYYIQRRINTIIFTLACNEPSNSCFCTSLGLGPFLKDGADVFVVDLGDKYLFEPLTQKGGDLLKEIPGLEEAAEEDAGHAEKLAAEAEANVTTKVQLDGLPEKLAEMFDAPVWNEIHQKCLGCGVCTYFCPTCHCFDIVDERLDDKGKRIRIWDSCLYPSFTLEASGHNPRPTGRERMRQRIMHKFNYFVETHNEIACVGCGRCVRSCPVSMDITKAIEQINNAE
ncbi:MAG: 4Fe-4S dicluster domain-containing protein [Planctomycetota bacterium]